MWSAGLSLLFLVLYGGCNALAARRASVPSLFMAWELRIPFVPVFVVPYLSVDLFFVASFFVCASTAELRVHARRILAALLVASAAFLLFPLRTAYPSPDVGGWTGALLRAFWSLDRPFNLAPSLHVALLALLAPVYARHTRGAVRWALAAWFALVAASPLLTWQHHVFDVVTGAALGLVCLFAVADPEPDPYGAEEFANERPDRSRGSAARNAVAARWYGAGAAAYAAFALALWPWGATLLWPAFALGALAAAYAGAGPATFRKREGRLPVAARVLLAPFLAGAWASYFAYRRAAPAFAEVAPGVLFGRRLLPSEARALRARGVSATLDLTAEYSESPILLRETRYRNVQVLDRTPPTPAELAACVAFVEAHAASGVYVHCALGYSRSACVAAAFLLASGRAASVEEAVDAVRRVRPQVVLPAPFVESLRAYTREIGPVEPA